MRVFQEGRHVTDLRYSNYAFNGLPAANFSMSDNRETVIRGFKRGWGNRDTATIMNPPISKLFLSIVFVALCAANAAGQCPREGSIGDPVAALRCAKVIYVSSSSALVGATVVESKLLKRTEFSQMGLVITREPDAADIVLELHHDRFTKYVYTAIDRRTNMVLASGKLSSLGGTVAGKVAKRFLKQVMQARSTAPARN